MCVPSARSTQAQAKAHTKWRVQILRLVLRLELQLRDMYVEPGRSLWFRIFEGMFPGRGGQLWHRRFESKATAEIRVQYVKVRTTHYSQRQSSELLSETHVATLPLNEDE